MLLVFMKFKTKDGHPDAREQEKEDWRKDKLFVLNIKGKLAFVENSIPAKIQKSIVCRQKLP